MREEVKPVKLPSTKLLVALVVARVRALSVFQGICFNVSKNYFHAFSSAFFCDTKPNSTRSSSDDRDSTHKFFQQQSPRLSLDLVIPQRGARFHLTTNRTLIFTLLFESLRLWTGKIMEAPILFSSLHHNPRLCVEWVNQLHFRPC
jgi:hypothetical protein